MRKPIGEAAGVVWRFLADNGQASASTVRRRTGLSTPLLQRAIGWLACEDKLRVETVDGKEKLCLR